MSEKETQEPKSSATLSMEAQSSVVIGLTFKVKEGLAMKDAKFYGNTADEIFNQHEQSIRRFLKLREDYAAGVFNPATGEVASDENNS